MSSSAIPPTPAGATKPSAPLGQVVQIQSLPDALKSVSRALRVQGEVVQQNPDGTTRIKTDQGNIDIQVRGRQPQPGRENRTGYSRRHPAASGNHPRGARARAGAATFDPAAANNNDTAFHTASANAGNAATITRYGNPASPNTRCGNGNAAACANRSRVLPRCRKTANAFAQFLSATRARRTTPPPPHWL